MIKMIIWKGWIDKKGMKVDMGKIEEDKVAMVIGIRGKESNKKGDEKTKIRKGRKIKIKIRK